jgi:hypothetical protein
MPKPYRQHWEKFWAYEAWESQLNPEITPATGSEFKERATIWGHMRHLAQNHEDGDHTPFMRDAQGELPDDPRPITHSHSEMGLSINHCGLYWEVMEWSTEASSSYTARGRGRTLAEALKDLEFER